MASNNLASGAMKLLEAGADPNNRGGAGMTPMECAQQSCARQGWEKSQFPEIN